MTIIDAVKRLERAGGENSKATVKLHEAVRNVAQLIEDNCPAGALLPHGYRVLRITSNVGAAEYLQDSEGNLVDGDGGYLHGDFGAPVQRQSRGTSLQFARDVAEGLLDEIAAWLEARVAESQASAVSCHQPGERRGLIQGRTA